MKVIALIYADEDVWESLPEAEQEATYERYRAFAAVAGAKLVDGSQTASTKAATTVRVRDGDVQVTDGPFAETKEQLGGFVLLDVASMDEAVDLASKIPGASHGAVELRAAYEEEAAA